MGENVPPILGEYGGLNLGVMEELGYTVRKKDENGDPVDEIDWEKTRAVQIRSNYIYINLKGRDKLSLRSMKALTGFMEMGYPRRKDMHRHRLPLFSWLQGRILKRERSQTG